MYEEPKITILFLTNEDILNGSPNDGGNSSGNNENLWEDENAGDWV